MNLTALKKLLMLSLPIVLIVFTTLNAQRNEYLATFPGGVVYLPTINSNNVVVKYHNVFGGVSKEAVFYPRTDTLAIYQLDTCKREFIALAWAFDVLERRFIDSTARHKEMFLKVVENHKKEKRKVGRKGWFRGFLWGVPVGIVGGVLAFVR